MQFFFVCLAAAWLGAWYTDKLKSAIETLMFAVNLDRLCKRFAGVVAVDDLSLTINEGECFALLGPNGAGKTTTMEILVGLQQPDSGKARVLGQRPSKSLAERMGVQLQTTMLPDHLRVAEALDLFAGFYRRLMPRDQLLSLCSLEPLLDKNCRSLSGGQRQRLALALALINDPELLLLDEPTAGLDPQARHHFWQLIREIKKLGGKTIIFTSHYMDEVEALADRLAIVDQGKLVVCGAPYDLLAQHFAGWQMSLPDHLQLPEALVGQVKSRSGRWSWLTDDVSYWLKVLQEMDMQQADLRVSRPGLDELFLLLTGHELRD